MTEDIGGFDNEPLSKSAQKRQAEQLQKLGKRIADLSAQRRAKLDLPPQLETAIDDYIRFPSREAKRRQLQFVGRVMRSLDIVALEQRLAELDGETADSQRVFHQLERWRDSMIHDDDYRAALSDYLGHHPQAPRQALRQAIQKARRARTEAEQQRLARALFRLLRDQA